MNFRTLDLNLLRVFDTVMAEGSITRAAERLAMTQPAVSNALKRLRDSVGEDLLTRAARGVAPTAFGEALWPQVRSALGQLRAALEPGDFDPGADGRVFRLAMADAMAAFLLPALVGAFLGSTTIRPGRVNVWGTLVGAFSLGILNKFLEPYAGAVLGKILVLVFIILFIQRRPRGLFALKGRSVE